MFEDCRAALDFHEDWWALHEDEIYIPLQAYSEYVLWSEYVEYKGLP